MGRRVNTASCKFLAPDDIIFTFAWDVRTAVQKFAMEVAG